MDKKTKRCCIWSGLLFLCFVVFTILVACYDVKPVGPEGTSVGFSRVNQLVFQSIGVHLVWYEITDWLGILAILFALGFGAVGFCQLVKRKHISKVDRSLLLLAGHYILVIGFYLFFEQVVINCRPVIIGELLEASYPSSHTMIVVCIMATASVQFRILYPERKVQCRTVDSVAALLILVTIIGRTVSGVHWLTDIVGGLLLSSSLVLLYCSAVRYKGEVRADACCVRMTSADNGSHRS